MIKTKHHNSVEHWKSHTVGNKSSPSWEQFACSRKCLYEFLLSRRGHDFGAHTYRGRAFGHIGDLHLSVRVPAIA